MAGENASTLVNTRVAIAGKALFARLRIRTLCGKAAQSRHAQGRGERPGPGYYRDCDRKQVVYSARLIAPAALFARLRGGAQRRVGAGEARQGPRPCTLHRALPWTLFAAAGGG